MTQPARTADFRVAEASAAGIAALGRLVWDRGFVRVAVLGASKNAGKTTALNALAAAASARGERVGLCSVGLDGEAFDAWLDTPKPRVRVEKGSLVLTDSHSAQAAGNLLRVLGPAGFSSALGPSVLCEARGPGGVQLCGVPHRAHLIAAVRALQAAGAERVLIDGAYHRQAAAHADVADALVVAVGAVLGEDAQTAAAGAATTLAALATPGEAELPLPAEGWLDVPGALADHWLPKLLQPGVRVLRVEGPSRVLLSAAGHAQLARRGVRVVAARPLALAAVASNPHRPGGVDEDGAQLQAAVAAVLRGLGLAVPVLDVVRGVVLSPENPAHP